MVRLNEAIIGGSLSTQTQGATLQDSVVIDRSKLTGESLGFLVETALKNYFGSDKVIRGNKAFDIHANSYRVDADVVPAFAYRHYNGGGEDDYIKPVGIGFLMMILAVYMPSLNLILKTTPLHLPMLAAIFALGIFKVFLMEFIKWTYNRKTA